MNVVWLLPAAAFLAAEAPGRPGAPRRALALLALGLVLAWVPDQHSAPWLYPLLPSLGNYKYVAAEALVLAGALASLRAATAAAGGG
jgi:hypothetical protein